LVFIMQNGACVGIETALGEAVGVAVAGHSSQLMAKAGVKLPIHSYTLQAMVSEPVKPCLDIVLLPIGTGVYASQSDKREIVFGGGLDRHPLLRPPRLAVDAGDRRLRPSRHVPRPRPTEADAAVGRHRRRRPRLFADHRPRAGSRTLPQQRLGKPAASRPFPPAARCSRICSRPAPATRSAARSTFRVFLRGALSEAAGSGIAHWA
jgi:hypothetical protein